MYRILKIKIDKFWRNFKNYHTIADILCSNAPPVIVIMSAKFEYMYYRDQRQMYSSVRKCWVSGYYLYYVRFCDRCHATCWAVCNSSALRHGQNKRQFDGKFPFNHQREAGLLFCNNHAFLDAKQKLNGYLFTFGKLRVCFVYI